LPTEILDAWCAKGDANSGGRNLLGVALSPRNATTCAGPRGLSTARPSGASRSRTGSAPSTRSTSVNLGGFRPASGHGGAGAWCPPDVANDGILQAARAVARYPW